MPPRAKKPQRKDLDSEEAWLTRFDPEYSRQVRREKVHRRAARITLKRLGR